LANAAFCSATDAFSGSPENPSACQVDGRNWYSPPAPEAGLAAVGFPPLSAWITQAWKLPGAPLYDAAGAALGSSGCREGRIYIEPQGMCVMAGIGVDDGRAEAALVAVRDRLATPHGILLLQPPYTRYSPALGEISSYPPGYKENGSVFCHVNPWVTIAEARLGHGDAALECYLRTCPSAREDISEVHRCEPYVHAQMIAGRDSPREGEAKNSWLTGSAAWNYVAVTQWILGIRPEHDGLHIDPCLPTAWGDVEVARRFRGTTYRITLRKRPGVTGRVVRLLVDGRAIEGSLIPLPGAAAGEVRVEATVE